MQMGRTILENKEAEMRETYRRYAYPYVFYYCYLTRLFLWISLRLKSIWN